MKRYPLTLNLGLLVFVMIMMYITKPIESVEPMVPDYPNNPTLISLDSIS